MTGGGSAADRDLEAEAQRVAREIRSVLRHEVKQKGLDALRAVLYLAKHGGTQKDALALFKTTKREAELRHLPEVARTSGHAGNNGDCGGGCK